MGNNLKDSNKLWETKCYHYFQGQRSRLQCKCTKDINVAIIV